MNDPAASVVEAVDLDTQIITDVSTPAQEIAPLKGESRDIDLGRWLINLFIIFHVTAIVVWNLPDTPLQESVSNSVRDYLTVTGCWQAWSMFSPDPVNQDTYCGAVIHYRDGSTKTYTFPRIASMGIFTKYRLERWRKFLENTNGNEDEDDWPYLARYAALQENPTPISNPPVSVDLYRYQRFIALNNNPPLRYLKSKMMTEDVIAMPSKAPLRLAN